MDEFKKYSQELEATVITAAKQYELLPNFIRKFSSVLDGEPSRELRRLVSAEKLKESGAFFTSAALAEFVMGCLDNSLTSNSVVADIACGTGDLLLASTQLLPKAKSLTRQIDLWGKQLAGHDIHPEFIEVTKWRLIIRAMQQCSRLDLCPSDINIEKMFPQIKVGDGLRRLDTIKQATHIVINPPFIKAPAPSDCGWAKGTVNSAALFLEKCVLNANPGTRIVAILPDVLRSGSRYRKWRVAIEQQTEQVSSRLCGQFDKWADVHVFILDLVVKENKLSDKSRWNYEDTTSKCTFSDFFDIHVGPVVDYRDPHEGDEVQFATSKNVKPWSTVTTLPQVRRFGGRLFNPPFIVVRRTSRQEDKFRAIGALITGTEPVAVENHLIVLSPKNNAVKTCEEGILKLKKTSTSAWLNNRIRCRHLTVSSLKELPW